MNIFHIVLWITLVSSSRGQDFDTLNPSVVDGNSDFSNDQERILEDEERFGAEEESPSVFRPAAGPQFATGESLFSLRGPQFGPRDPSFQPVDHQFLHRNSPHFEPSGSPQLLHGFHFNGHVAPHVAPVHPGEQFGSSSQVSEPHFVPTSQPQQGTGCLSEDQECIDFTSCNAFTNLLDQIQERGERKGSPWRNHMVEIAKERICGHRSERRICCPKERSSPSHPNSAFPFIGEFLGKEGVSGRIYQLDDKTLVINNFQYPASGPVSYLVGGFEPFVEDEPPNVTEGEDVVFQFPHTGEVITNLDDPRLQVLPKFEGSRNLMLTLPDDDGSSTSGLKWIMIWCNKFGVNLGHAILDVGDDSGDSDIMSDIFN